MIIKINNYFKTNYSFIYYNNLLIFNGYVRFDNISVRNDNKDM